MTAPDPMRARLDVAGLQQLYRQFGDELQHVRAEERTLYDRWAATATDMRHADGTIRYVSWVPKSLRPKLASLRYRIKAIRKTADLDPSFPDIDCELTYLLLRAAKPETVVEISPAGGWSTSWILSALRDNRRGTLRSYDIIDDSTRTVPRELQTGRWTFERGDVKGKLQHLPRKIDYLFLDSAHSTQFAQWYAANLLPRVRAGGIVSVDDVLDDTGRPTGYGEAAVILQWLRDRQIPWFTASPHCAKGAYDSIHATKAQLGMDRPIHPSTDNPAIFFAIPE